MSSSLLDFAQEPRIEYEEDRFFDYLREFKKADRSFKSAMGWSGPRIDKSDKREVQQFQKRVLAEAYHNKRIDFEDALIGYLLVVGGYSYDKVKSYKS